MKGVITNDILHRAWDAGEVQWHRCITLDCNKTEEMLRISEAAKELLALDEEIQARAADIFKRRGLSDWIVCLDLRSTRKL